MLNYYNIYKGFGTTGMDTSNSIISGRPYGEVAVLICKSIRKECQIDTTDDSRLLGGTVNTSDMSCYFFYISICHTNVMITVICLLNTLEKYPSLIEESVTSNLIVLGDYNTAIDTVLKSELL